MLPSALSALGSCLCLHLEICRVAAWSNYYLGGPANDAPKPAAVRLSRSTRPAVRRQKYCDTMDLTPQGPTLVNLRRIRIRCVQYVTKVLGAAEARNNQFMHDWPSLLNEPDGLRLDRSSRLAKLALSM